VPIPNLHRGFPSQQRPQEIVPRVPIFSKERSPELIWLLVDVVLPTLPWDRSREKDGVTMPHKVLDKSSARRRWDVFAYFQALYKIEASLEIERFCDVQRNKRGGRYEKRRVGHILAVNAHVRRQTKSAVLG
jgi:hypothetical protein